MYGSYGSYSSTPAMEIPSRKTTYHSSSHLDASCAFPSWPRRDSLDSDNSARGSSYISDEDLLFEPVFPDEDTRSVSSCGSNTPSPQLAPVYHLSDDDIAAFREQQAAQQRQFMQSIIEEKERRRQAAKAKKARKAKMTSPTPRSKLSAIVEAAE